VSLLLARELVERGLVPPGRMDDVLQRQVVFGGALDTNVLELGLVDEARLTEALAALHKLPAADAELLQRRDPRVVNLFPLRLVRKYQALPVYMAGRVLHVLACERLHPLIVEELSFLLSLEIKTHIVCQARLQVLMHEWYEKELEPRFLRLAGRLGPFPGSGGQAAEQQVHLPGPGVAERPPPVDRQRMQQVLGRLEQVEQLERNRRRQARRGRFTLNQASQAIMRAESRDELVDYILRFARQFASFVALFVVGEDDILGWDAVGGGDAEHIKKARVPRGAASILTTVLNTHAPYLGDVSESLGNNEFYLAIGRDRPVNAFVVPLTVRGRVVALLYGDSGRQTVRSAQLSPLLVFASRLGTAFEQLILRLKHAVHLERERQAREKSRRLAEQAAISSLGGGEVPVGEGAERGPVPGDGASLDDFPLPTPREAGEPVLEEPVVVDESFIDRHPETLEPPPVVEVEMPPQEAQAEPEPQPERPVQVEPEPQPERPVRVEPEPEPQPEQPVQVEPELETLQPQPERPVQVEPEPEPWPEPAPAAAGPVAPARPAPPSLPDAETLCRQLVGPDRERASLAADALATLGLEALPAVMRRFPGPLDFDVRGSYDSIPPLREHGPLIGCLLDMGPPAAPAVAERLDDEDPVARYYAVRLLEQLQVPEQVPAIAGRLTDRETFVRLAAVDALLHYRRSPEFQRLLERLRAQLDDIDPDRQAVAAALLGNFRDREAVPALAAKVKSSERMVSRAAREALCFITKQDFGTSGKKWLKWWKANQGRRRVEWLIEGLLSRNRDIRFSSAQELNRLTGEYFGYFYDANKAEREKAARQWRRWWETRGRLLNIE